MYREVLGKLSPNKHRYTQEELEKKHNVKIGDRVKVSMSVASAGKDAITEFGYCRSMFWKDFEKALE